MVGLFSLRLLPSHLRLLHHLPVLISHAAFLLLVLSHWFLLLTQTVILPSVELTQITRTDLVTSDNANNALLTAILTNLLS